MTETTPPLFLLGPPAETAAVAEALERDGQPCRQFATPPPLLDALFYDPPWAVVVWDQALGSQVERDLCEVLRHHLEGQESLIILARSEGAADLHLDCGAFGAVDAPVDPSRLKELLKQGKESRSATGCHIPRILVVDDDQDIVLLGSHIVTGLGMIPLVAFDGLQAVERARTFKPDLLLLDINMPGLDGYGVIEKLKADASTNLIPIIVFSARRDEDDKVRALRMGADDYVTKPFNITELSARIERLLKRTRTGISASSTTGLPGSVSIEQVLSERVRSQQPLAFLYLDIDHFKAFNDRYGFARGDSLIRQTADIVLSAVREFGNPADFVGHVGGDDFVVATSPDRAIAIADAIIGAFDRITPLYYDAVDRDKRYVEVEDRRGNRTQTPLVSLSIAIVTNEGREFHHAAQVADVAAQLKRFAKAKPGSLWVKDQRANAVE